MQALHTALKHDAVFSSVAAHSSYFLTVGEKILETVLDGPAEPSLEIYADWGEYDIRADVEAWNMPESNRQLVKRLKEAGYEPQGGQVPQGGGWFHWKTRVGDSLRALFPVPGEDVAGR